MSKGVSETHHVQKYIEADDVNYSYFFSFTIKSTIHFRFDYIYYNKKTVCTHYYVKLQYSQGTIY
jgi:hypothetical protein